MSRLPHRLCVPATDRVLDASCAPPRRACRGTAFIDLNDAICPTRRCAPVIGNVLVYRQTSHLTRTYVKTLAPRLEQALAKAGVPIRKPPLRPGL